MDDFVYTVGEALVVSLEEVGLFVDRDSGLIAFFFWFGWLRLGSGDV